MVSRAVREAASADDDALVINARVDGFLGPYIAGADPGTQIDRTRRRGAGERLPRGRRRLCVRDRLVGARRDSSVHGRRRRTGERVRVPQLSSLADVAALGVARVSWAMFLFEAAMAQFGE